MAVRMRALLLPFLALAGLVLASAAQADTWAPPRVTTYYSANRTARLIVTPHFPPANRAPVSRRGRGPSAPDVSHAVLQRRDARGRWVVAWRGPLRNEVAPVEALVADSGRYFATFDDWGDVGIGPNAVVIYDGSGRTIRALSLIDLVPLDYIEALPHTSFSIWWSGRHRFSEDGERLILSIAIPSTQEFPNTGGRFELAVTLADGASAALTGPEWDRAVAAAAAARAAARDRRAAYFAFMTEPILPPRSANPEQWHEYLTEVSWRLTESEAGVPMVILFRRPPAQDYVMWGGTPRGELLSRNPSRYIAIASPDGLPLAPALGAIVSARSPGWLHDVRLFIVADAAAWPELTRVMGPSGAALIRLDPATPVPQRPERLREHLEMQAALTRNESAQD